MTVLSTDHPLTPQHARLLLAGLPTEIAPGLDEAELAGVERRWGFRFAPEHRTLLSAGLPLGDGWPDWRSGDPDRLAARLAWPVEGVLSEVGPTSFWVPAWGPRPGDDAEAEAAIRLLLAGAPAMVPVFGHRYLPADPEVTGYPVLSMYGVDVIHYGLDLLDYLYREFGVGEPAEDRLPLRVPFWSDVIDAA
ncbi:hypothetical protein [Peterkaempfera bronchialis]|uniref:hypothetical protein n=1 Tax=Peterkaempfera bronchialis TaxID=2126346 RepID=UPI001E3C2FD4|nr:hypothetical protein [Peterkaempfera bronchialis]